MRASRISLLLVVVFLLLRNHGVFRDGLMLLGGAGPVSEIIVKALGSLLEVLCAALIIVLTPIGQENLDAIVEPVEVTLALISEMGARDGRGSDTRVPVGLLQLRFAD